MRCASCGKTISNDSSFCNYCGKAVVGSGTAAQNVSPEPCGLCGGSGQYGGLLSSNPCPACGGKGSVLVIVPAKKCALCGGSGKHGGFLGENICSACAGSGWAHIVK